MRNPRMNYIYYANKKFSSNRIMRKKQQRLPPPPPSPPPSPRAHPAPHCDGECNVGSKQLTARDANDIPFSNQQAPTFQSNAPEDHGKRRYSDRDTDDDVMEGRNVNAEPSIDLNDLKNEWDSNEGSICNTDEKVFTTEHASVENDVYVESLENDVYIESLEQLPKTTDCNMDFTSAADPLHPNLKISKMEILFIMMNLFLRHNLSNAALSDILKMINLMVGYKAVPETYLGFSSFFVQRSFTRHYICERCEYYIGEIKEQCVNCKNTNTQFFITFDFISNLRDVLVRNWNAITEFQAKAGATTHVTDILNAGVAQARKLTNSITLTLNTDGVKIFNSNVKKSLWPLIICINDLPPHLRFLRKNVLIAGLWLQSGEPNLDVFLKPLSNMLKEIHNNGLDIGFTKIETIQTTACCVDTKARCKIQNFKQFNGYDACSFCLHPGDIVKKQIRYGYKPNVPKRNMLDTLRAMAVSSSRGDPVNGVKGISPLIRIPNFDVIRNCPVDYMHGILLGVCRQLCRLWFETPSCPSYIKNKISLIDSMLTSMDPFAESSRNARKITDRNSWKANEWLHWLLHYSPVCLKRFLPQQYYEHYSLLVSSITLMLQNEISPETFAICDKNLRSFVIQFEQLYGMEEMTYNVHLVSHLVDCSKDYGPLWAFSLFVFEDINGMLKKYVKGPKEPIVQIANRCVMSHTRFNANVNFMQPSVKQFWNKLNKSQAKHAIKNDGMYHLDNLLLNPYNNNRSFDKADAFEHRGFLYRPKSTIDSFSKHGRKSHNDCYFSIQKDSEVVFGEIHYILNDKDGTYFLYKVIDTGPIDQNTCRASVLEDFVIVRINNSLSKHIKLQIDDIHYLCKLQYKLHID